jgi:hypothetical protein
VRLSSEVFNPLAWFVEARMLYAADVETPSLGGEAY